jgi:predicted Rossmann fold flavoprotein
METIEVVVLGGGAAGLMCALTAAGQGRQVRVLERSNKLGKKILMSGGGRCNFTNLQVEAENFLSDNAHFVKSALRRYPPHSFISLVESYEIEFEERKHGQLFCVHSAKEILAMLEAECLSLGVQIQTHCDVNLLSAIAPKASGPERFSLRYTHQGQTVEVQSESVVVATGALSIPTLGGSDQGYQLAEQFGIKLVPRRAGLVPFMFTGDLKNFCVALAGVSLPVAARCGSQGFVEDLLFTHRGLSGPVMLQISSYWTPGEALTLDVCPDRDLAEWLVTRKHQKPNQTVVTTLSEVLPRSFAEQFVGLYYAQFLNVKCAELRDQQLGQVGRDLNAWQIKPAATEGYRTAEVTLGGVSTDALSSKTLEARGQPGLFFVGEVVDVSGHLGGFNFQWAWASGFCAGQVA